MEESAAKRRRCEDEGSDNTGNSIWLVFNEWYLTLSDKDVLQNAEELTDWHITFGLKLLNQQFPFLVGLLPTHKIFPISGWSCSFVQIFHCRTNHWVTVTTIGCQPNEVFIYDSLYSDVESETKEKIATALSSSTIKIVIQPVQKQEGIKDCGCFALDFATHLAFDNAPDTLIDCKFQ